MTANTLLMVPVRDISPGGFQPRAAENRDHVSALAENMRLNGFLPEHPLEVIADGGRYVLVGGHHRYYAAVMVGLDCVPVVVKVGTELELRYAAISGNDSNLPMKPCEQARAYGELITLGATVGDIAKQVCKQVDFIERRLLLLKLDDSISKLVDSNNMPLSLAERLSGLSANEQVRAVGKVKDLELPAALAAVDAMIQAAAGVCFPGFETLTVEEQTKRRAALDGFNKTLKGLDAATGSFTEDNLDLALAALRNPQTALNHLNAIQRELERVRGRVLMAAGTAIGGGAMVFNGKRFSGRRLAELRAGRFSVREFRALSGVANITDLEKGRVIPHPRTVRRLADALGVDQKELMA